MVATHDLDPGQCLIILRPTLQIKVTYETVNNLRRGEQSDGWYWSIALLGGHAVSFALYMADRSEGGALDEISLAELHTHPEAQGQHLASTVALAGLRRVRQKEVCSAETPVTLVVARERESDDHEHPFELYHQKLGFQVVDRDHGLYIIDGQEIPTWKLGTTLGALDAALSERVTIELES